MVVVSITDCPPTLRGDLTKWLFEINVGVYVGHVSARVRDELWNRIVENCKVGRVTMVYQTNNEQRIKFRVHNSDWKPIDFDGLTLMLRPVDDYLNRPSSLRPGFSKAAQHQIVKRIQAAEERKKAKLNYDVLIEPVISEGIKLDETASVSCSECKIEQPNAAVSAKQGCLGKETENETQMRAEAGESRPSRGEKSEQLCSKDTGTKAFDDERTRQNQSRGRMDNVPVHGKEFSETQVNCERKEKMYSSEPVCTKRTQNRPQEEIVSSHGRVLPDTPVIRKREEKRPSKSVVDPIEIVQVTETVRVRKKSKTLDEMKEPEQRLCSSTQQSECAVKSMLHAKNQADDYVIIDIETTGLDENENDIIEFGAIRVRNGVMTERFQCFVEPNDKLPQFIVNLTGITDAMLEKQGIPLEEALKQFISFICHDRLVGHNIEFDIKFIQAALKKCGLEKLSNSTTCTLNLAKVRLPSAKRYSLQALMLYLNIESKGEHRSLSDCENVFSLYNKLIKVIN